MGKDAHATAGWEAGATLPWGAGATLAAIFRAVAFVFAKAHRLATLLLQLFLLLTGCDQAALKGQQPKASGPPKEQIAIVPSLIVQTLGLVPHCRWILAREIAFEIQLNHG